MGSRLDREPATGGREPQVGGKKGCSRKWAVFEFFMVVKPDNKTEYLCFTQFPTNAATSLYLKSSLIHLRNKLYPVIASLTTPASLARVARSMVSANQR